MCNNWPDLPISVNGDTGGLIGNTVIICGGHDGSYVDECYSLTSEKATLVTHMSVGRQYAASVVINDNILWVTGGYRGVLAAQQCGHPASCLQGEAQGPGGQGGVPVAQ